MRNLTFLIFVFLTFCCWGLYGPVLHVGQEEMGADGKLSSLRPFICVGFAYFVIAVIYPLMVLYGKGESGSWSAAGIFWSFTAGLVGALGALGIILAFKFQGKPVYVMPLVFGLAPVVNTFVSMFMARNIREASPIFYVGVLIAACGAAGVLYNKPAPNRSDAVKTSSASAATLSLPLRAVTYRNGATQDSTSASDSAEQTDSSAEPTGSAETSADLLSAPRESDDVAATETAVSPPKSSPNYLWIVLSIALTAVCWGAYGPVLHKGQGLMKGSRLRPFLCVGLAYFVVAVLGPIALMPVFSEPGGWNVSGSLWSMGAGAAGALGALGIIYAFNFGGKPVYVMPLVFGFAPVINVVTEIIHNNLFGAIPLGFWISLAAVICGAMIVLTNAPRGKKPAPQPAAAT